MRQRLSDYAKQLDAVYHPLNGGGLEYYERCKASTVGTAGWPSLVAEDLTDAEFLL